jgi:hypothetical protein
MRDGVCKHSSVRLPDLTADWEFRATRDPAERGEKGRCGGERGENTPAKSAETGSESRGFKEEWKN